MVSGRALIIGILAIIERLRPDHAKLPEPHPSVTVLIPAHNEETVIVQTVTSVLLSDYDNISTLSSSTMALPTAPSNFSNPTLAKTTLFRSSIRSIAEKPRP